MFGRENLIWEWSDDLDAGFKVYDVAQANEVMDKMETELKNRQRSIDKLISEKYELSCKLREYETNGTFNEMRNRIKELEFSYESHVNDMYLLETRIKELEAENNQLKYEIDDSDNLLAHY